MLPLVTWHLLSYSGHVGGVSGIVLIHTQSWASMVSTLRAWVLRTSPSCRWPFIVWVQDILAPLPRGVGYFLVSFQLQRTLWRRESGLSFPQQLNAVPWGKKDCLAFLQQLATLAVLWIFLPVSAGSVGESPKVGQRPCVSGSQGLHVLTLGL